MKTEARQLIETIMHLDRDLYLELRACSTCTSPTLFAIEQTDLIGAYLRAGGVHHDPETCRGGGAEIWAMLRGSSTRRRP
ncbi:hypothetical protein [Allochromatium vinosum]|uniref:CMP/dCMP deaminase, zinc-binding protein n=1 Tax=Allochromatium vinosum (strain ATCC 17899 / DSM 180 / NBRC 103801 / NCIMB 10441 / D) TaxID=572477 RepID=D3RW93_ALLVD|nr:hypothetical protein [Allochromatium vinosum]ADC64105.1 CMP/dCMP deaminase, zinc-binding protein [Allochromatium vinosum DSM 180]